MYYKSEEVVLAKRLLRRLWAYSKLSVSVHPNINLFWLKMLLYKSSTLQQYRAVLPCNSNPWTLLEVTKQMQGFCGGFKPRPTKGEEVCNRFSFVSGKMVPWYSNFLVIEYCIHQIQKFQMAHFFTLVHEVNKVFLPATWKRYEETCTTHQR